MKDDFEGRWRKEEDISRPSRSLSTSVHVDNSDSDFVEEMSQNSHKLGTEPKWSAHADAIFCDTFSPVERQVTLANHKRQRLWKD